MAISTFEQQREKWIKYLSDGRYSIVHDYLDMVGDYKLFKTLVNLQKIAPSDAKTSHLMTKYFLRSYGDLQCIRIRRLTVNGRDKTGKETHFKKEISVNALIDKIIDHRNLITRQAYVCRTGRPYDYERYEREEDIKIEEHLKSYDSYMISAGGLEGASAWRKSQSLHECFDRLSGKTIDSRSPNDLIKLEILEEKKEILTNVSTKITKFASKHIAHRDPRPSQRAKAPTPSYPEIEVAIKEIYKIITFISIDVLDNGSYSNSMLYSFSFGADVILPIVPPSISQEDAEAVFNQVQDDITSWH